MPVETLDTAPKAGGRTRRARDAGPAPFVLLDDGRSPGGRCLLFEDPVEVVRCDRPADVPAALDAVSRAPDRGLHAAGFLAYELGYLLEPRLAPLLPPDRDVPLLWMGLFERPRTLDATAARGLIEERRAGGHEVGNVRPSIEREAYLAAVRRVREYIAAGDVYQINFTFKLLFEFAGDPLSLYAALRRAQPVAHGGLIRAPGFDLLSLSPELFLSVRDGRALAKPMKGTAARGPTPAEDARRRDWLRADPKSRAENLMIVDLLRNDLSRVAEVGTVEVPELFTVETYSSLHQMVSSVRACLRPGVDLAELVRSLFPCGSITGAPKVRAMEIIHELEPRPRGAYTGAIGMVAPNGDLAFNVAIRTVALHDGGRGEMGIGSGIVFDSDPGAEFEECLLKARFLTDAGAPFQLIETLRWTREDGYYLLDEHLERLAASAAHFGYPCEAAAVRRALLARAAGFDGDAARVRLLLDAEGALDITAAPLAPPGPDTVWRYAIAQARIDRDDPCFYHKTTRRDLYDGELARLRAETGCDEVVFLNDRGELTEGSRTNLFADFGGRLATPPVSCGLLAGTLRRALLEDPGVETEERVLTPADLARADAVYLGNSVRGLIRARPIA
jgi:para-aminobenzoate synthetase/4-amino-4-deoxychorismate lyase